MTPANPRTRQQFLVELWREPSGTGALSGWRGIVKYIAHDKERYVATLADVTAFIAACIDAPAPAENGRPESDDFRTPRTLT